MSMKNARQLLYGTAGRIFRIERDTVTARSDSNRQVFKVAHPVCVCRRSAARSTSGARILATRRATCISSL